jgi:tRNA(Arg) A34 adenosine deaminase TadA
MIEKTSHIKDFCKTNMLLALDEAIKAESLGEVPVGAVIVDARTGEVICSSHNEVETKKDATAHAEMIVIKKACEKLGEARLDFCDLYVTLEPCVMCAGAIAHARIRRLYFGAYDPKGGGVEHGVRVFENKNCNHKIEVYGGILEQKCSQMLKAFFAKLRLK